MLVNASALTKRTPTETRWLCLLENLQGNFSLSRNEAHFVLFSFLEGSESFTFKIK